MDVGGVVWWDGNSWWDDSFWWDMDKVGGGIKVSISTVDRDTDKVGAEVEVGVGF